MLKHEALNCGTVWEFGHIYKLGIDSRTRFLSCNVHKRNVASKEVDLIRPAHRPSLLLRAKVLPLDQLVCT